MRLNFPKILFCNENFPLQFNTRCSLMKYQSKLFPSPLRSPPNTRQIHPPPAGVLFLEFRVAVPVPFPFFQMKHLLWNHSHCRALMCVRQFRRRSRPDSPESHGVDYSVDCFYIGGLAKTDIPLFPDSPNLLKANGPSVRPALKNISPRTTCRRNVPGSTRNS